MFDDIISQAFCIWCGNQIESGKGVPYTDQNTGKVAFLLCRKCFQQKKVPPIVYDIQYKFLLKRRIEK